jgi:hypothetical protein
MNFTDYRFSHNANIVNSLTSRVDASVVSMEQNYAIPGYKA